MQELTESSSFTYRIAQGPRLLNGWLHLNYDQTSLRDLIYEYTHIASQHFFFAFQYVENIRFEFRWPPKIFEIPNVALRKYWSVTPALREWILHSVHVTRSTIVPSALTTVRKSRIRVPRRRYFLRAHRVHDCTSNMFSSADTHVLYGVIVCIHVCICALRSVPNGTTLYARTDSITSRRRFPLAAIARPNVCKKYHTIINCYHREFGSSRTRFYRGRVLVVHGSKRFFRSEWTSKRLARSIVLFVKCDRFPIKNSPSGMCTVVKIATVHEKKMFVRSSMFFMIDRHFIDSVRTRRGILNSKHRSYFTRIVSLQTKRLFWFLRVNYLLIWLYIGLRVSDCYSVFNHFIISVTRWCIISLPFAYSDCLTSDCDVETLSDANEKHVVDETVHVRGGLPAQLWADRAPKEQNFVRRRWPP